MTMIHVCTNATHSKLCFLFAMNARSPVRYFLYLIQCQCHLSRDILPVAIKSFVHKIEYNTKIKNRKEEKRREREKERELSSANAICRQIELSSVESFVAFLIFCPIKFSCNECGFISLRFRIVSGHWDDATYFYNIINIKSWLIF